MRSGWTESVLIVALAAPLLNACGHALHVVQGPRAAGQGSSPAAMRGDIAELAGRVDRGFEDGWVAGRDPRIFKSGYAAVAPATKADFALAYHAMLAHAGQDLERDIKSYVPYADRARFAQSWWLSSPYGKQFSSLSRKMQVVWAHESMLDAGELWWRVYEARSGRVGSGGAIAHDVEQNMVSQYMEDERTRGSLATQLK